MRYGVALSTFEEFCNPRLVAELAREAEDAGWDGVFVPDHIHWGQHRIADAWVTLSAIASKTERVKLGPMVTPIPRLRPWKLARESVTLDHLSGGRLILGVGSGGLPHEEFEVFGEPGDPKIHGEKLDEGLAVLSGLWSGKPFTFSGKHYEVKEACFLPTPLQSPRIPIWVASGYFRGKAQFRRAARWDGIYPVTSPLGTGNTVTPEGIREMVAYIKQYRKSEDPFDVVVSEDIKDLDRYLEGGATWWLDTRGESVKEVTNFIREGPPSR